MDGIQRGVARGVSTGLGKALGAFLQGGRAEQQGFDSEMQAQTRLAQALSAMRASEASADLHTAQADGVRLSNDATRRRPDQVEEGLAGSLGLDLPTLRAARQRIATGQAPEGMTLDPQVVTKVGQALARFLPATTAEKDLNPAQWAQALGSYRTQDLGDSVLSGQRTAGQVGAAQAAIEGKPLYNADQTGAVLDLFGGGLATDNPMAGATIKLRGAQTNQANATAGAQTAHAGLYRAQADEVKNGAGKGGAKAPAGYRWLADGVTLEAIPGGPADPNTKGAKQAKPPTEGQSKALLFGSRMAAADEALAELEADGIKRPGAIKTAAEGIAGAVPLVGDSLAKGAGFATNWTQSGPQQRVEQAQRDFINAVLRRESGAAINPGEFANAAVQYFPQPGDKPEVLRQKAANRRAAIAGFKAEVGDAFLPEFDRIVSEARAARTPAPAGQKSASTGGATGTWDDPSSGWRIEPVKK